MLLVVALVFVVILVISAIVSPIWLAREGVAAIANPLPSSINEKLAAVAVYTVIWTLLMLFVAPLVPDYGPLRLVVGTGLLLAIYVFFRRPILDLVRLLLGAKSTPVEVRPGERILQRHATGAAGQLGGSQLMQKGDLLRLGMVRPNGDDFPHIGVIDGQPLVYTGDSHLLTIAPAGSGKSSGPVTANLLTYTGGIIVTDPKGELARLTAHWRAEKGAVVHVVDPWGILADTADNDDEADEVFTAIPGGVRATFNPLDLIPGRWENGQPIEGPDSIDNAYLVADALLMEGSKSDPHWDRTAKALITGLLLVVALEPTWMQSRTLTSLNELLALPPEEFREFLVLTATVTSIAGARAELNQFLDKGEKEASGVRSTVNINMRFLQGAAMKQAFGGSSIDWAKVKSQGHTVYLCIPPSRLTTHAQFLRLMFTTAIAKMETMPPARYPNGNTWRPVLFLMDEFANLGRMDKIIQAYTLFRGYGLKLWAFVQDLSQIKKLYGDGWESLVPDVIQAFGTRDKFTSEYISDISGDFTQRIVSQSSSVTQTQNAPVEGQSKGTTGTSSSQTTNETYMHTRLLLPSDVRELYDTEQILIIEGRSTIQWRVRWFQHTPYAAHAHYLERRAAMIEAQSTATMLIGPNEPQPV